MTENEEKVEEETKKNVEEKKNEEVKVEKIRNKKYDPERPEDTFFLTIIPDQLKVPPNGWLVVWIRNYTTDEYDVKASLTSMFFQVDQGPPESFTLPPRKQVALYIKLRERMNQDEFAFYDYIVPEGYLEISHNLIWKNMDEKNPEKPNDLGMTFRYFRLTLEKETEQTKNWREIFKGLIDDWRIAVKEYQEEDRKNRLESDRKERWEKIHPVSVLFKPRYVPSYLDEIDKMTDEEIKERKEKEIKELMKEKEKEEKKEREMLLKKKEEREKREEKAKAKKKEESKKTSEVKPVSKTPKSFQKSLENAKLEKAEVACDPSENLKATPQKSVVKKPEESKPAEAVKVEKKTKNPVKAVAQKPKKKKKNPCCVII